MEEREILNMMQDMKPNRYGVVVTLGKTVGDFVEAAIETDYRDFAIIKLMHCVVGDDGTNDEQYSLDFSLGNDERFFKSSMAPMAKTYGSCHTNLWEEFVPAIEVPAKTTIYVKLVNRYSANLQDDLTIQIWFCGDELKKPKVV